MVEIKGEEKLYLADILFWRLYIENCMYEVIIDFNEKRIDAEGFIFC